MLPPPPKILNSKKNREEIRGKCRVNNPGEARAVKKTGDDKKEAIFEQCSMITMAGTGPED
jgi:hypothetical protein